MSVSVFLSVLVCPLGLFECVCLCVCLCLSLCVSLCLYECVCMSVCLSLSVFVYLSLYICLCRIWLEDNFTFLGPCSSSTSSHLSTSLTSHTVSSTSLYFSSCLVVHTSSTSTSQSETGGGSYIYAAINYNHHFWPTIIDVVNWPLSHVAITVSHHFQASLSETAMSV